MIGTLVTPISNDTRSNDLRRDELLVATIVVTSLAFELVNFVEARDGGHEAEERVYSYSYATLTHEDRGLVTFENLQMHGCKFIICDGSLVIKEFRIATNLS